jgi:hypothetical protein
VLEPVGAHDTLIPMNFYFGHQFPFNLAHELGAVKFGTDPRSSVLDVYCRPQDLDDG